MPQRQADGQRQPFALVAREVDLPAVFAHDAAHDEQPEPAPAGLRGEIRLENLAHILLRNPPARVRETHREEMVIHIRADAKNPAALHRLEGVLDHVVKRLLELVAIRLDQRQLFPQLLLHEDVPVLDLRLQKRHRLRHQRIHILQLLFQMRGPDRTEELLHDRVQPRDFIQRHIQRLLQLRARPRRQLAQPPLHELEMDVQRVQRIADLVRHARREQRQRRQLFALDRLLRGAPRLRDVAEDHRVAHHLRHRRTPRRRLI